MVPGDRLFLPCPGTRSRDKATIPPQFLCVTSGPLCLKPPQRFADQRPPRILRIKSGTRHAKTVATTTIVTHTPMMFTSGGQRAFGPFCHDYRV